MVCQRWGFRDKFKSDGWLVRYHSMLNICEREVHHHLMVWHGTRQGDIWLRNHLMLWVAEFIFMHNCFLFVRDSKSIMNYYVYLYVFVPLTDIFYSSGFSVLLRKLCFEKRRLKNFCSVSVCDMFGRFFSSFLFFAFFFFKNGNHSVLKGELGQSK